MSLTVDEFREYITERYEQNANGSFDRFGKEFLESGEFTVRIEYDSANLSWGEAHIGTAFGSCQDYGRRYKKLKNGEMSEQELEDEVMGRVKRMPRYIDFMQDDMVVTGVVVVVRSNGYAIYPDPEELV